MLYQVNCSKCGETFWVDVGDMDPYEDENGTLDRIPCPGHHVELMSGHNYLSFTGEKKEGKALTDTAWLEATTASHGRLYNTKEVSEHFEITGFSYGAAFGYEKATKNKVVLDFDHSPEKHERYYWVT
jgi:hypothetical protein